MRDRLQPARSRPAFHGRKVQSRVSHELPLRRALSNSWGPVRTAQVSVNRVEIHRVRVMGNSIPEPVLVELVHTLLSRLPNVPRLQRLRPLQAEVGRRRTLSIVTSVACHEYRHRQRNHRQNQYQRMKTNRSQRLGHGRRIRDDRAPIGIPSAQRTFVSCNALLGGGARSPRMLACVAPSVRFPSTRTG